MQQNIGTSYLKEYNYISRMEGTHFYLKFSKPLQYGVCINIKDLDKSDTIIKQFQIEAKHRLEAWRKDLLQQKYIDIILKGNEEKWNEYIELLKNGGNKTIWIKESLRTHQI